MRWFRRSKPRSTRTDSACQICGDPVAEDTSWCESCLATVRCSFCGAFRQQVRHLIAGPEVYICDRCTRLCLDAVDQDNEHGTIGGLVVSMVDTLRGGKVTEEDDVAAIVEAAVRVARDRGALLMEIAGTAFQLQRPDLAARALHAVPAEDRDFTWAQRCCAARYQCGDYDAAMDAIRDLDLDEVDPADRLRHRLNELYCSLRATPAPRADEHVAMLREVDSLGGEIDSLLDGDAHVWRCFADEIRAACFFALGKTGAARGVLEALAGEGDTPALTPSGRVLLGDCLARLGRDAEAREVWRAVHDATAAGLRAHHDAAERLAGGNGPYR